MPKAPISKKNESKKEILAKNDKIAVTLSLIHI